MSGIDNPKWPKLIRITPTKGVEIDGKEFPWYITENGASIEVGSRSQLTSVTLTIPCDRVEIEDMTAPVVGRKDDWSGDMTSPRAAEDFKDWLERQPGWVKERVAAGPVKRA